MRPERQQSAISNQLSAVSNQSADLLTADLLSPVYCLLVNKGFSLLEIVIVLAVMGLMAGALAPVALHLIGSKKAFANRDELQAVKKAVIGDPLATQWGSEATFGYIGDIGSLPASLQDLYTQPVGVPLFSFNTTLKIGAGWRGPYVAEKSYSSGTESLQDPYKNTYSYSTTITTDATLGAEVRATIRSPGPNRTDNGGTQDDLTERILKTEVLANAAGMIKNSEGAGIPMVSVTINYPSGGSLTSYTETTDDEGRYRFYDEATSTDIDIPMGERSITLQPGLVYVPGTAYATGSSGSNVSFQVANLSSSSITVSSIRVYCLINPYTYYSYVYINGTRRDSLTSRIWTEATPPDGTVVTLTSVPPLAGSTMQRDASLIRLQSSRIEIPDIELTTIGAGSTMTVEVRDFYDDLTGGSLVNMAGIPFKVTFSNGSKAIFTPRKQL